MPDHMILDVNALLIAQVVAIGLVAGLLGGLLGVGGSTIIIPGLALALGYHQHLYQAAAMIANIAVSIPAAVQHRRAGATVKPVLRWMLPTALLFVMLGVWLSNLPLFRGVDGGRWLGRVLALFLVYVIAVNTRRIFVPRPETLQPGAPTHPGSTTPAASKSIAARSASVGSVMGTIAGLLGIGGGAIAVPLQQIVLKLPLRYCIANSAAVICVSAAIGALYKNASLYQHGYHWHDSVCLALILAPSAWLGGHLGANLTHRLPVRQVRIAFVGLMIVAAVKMVDIF